MKAFWRFVIGGGMILFGIIGITSMLFLEPEADERRGFVFPTFIPTDKNEAEERKRQAEEAVRENEVKTAEEIARQKEQHDNDRAELHEAVAERDVDKCLRIQDDKWKTECRDSIYFAMALRDQFIDLCDKIETPEKKRYCRDELLLVTAKEESDYSVCVDIVNSTLRSQCQDAEARESIMSAKSVGDCEKIKSKEERELCFGFFVTRAAASVPDPEIDACDEIIDSGQKQSCRLQMATEKATQEKDPTVCRDLVDGTEVNECLKRVAAEFENNKMTEIITAGEVDECADIEDEGARGYCVDQALVRKAINDHDPELCIKIKADRHREKCQKEATEASNRFFNDLARKDKDPKWCRLIIAKAAQTNCENYLAQVAAQKD